MNILAISGFVNRPEVRQINDKVRVLSFSLSVPNSGPKDLETGKRGYGFFDVTHFNARDWLEASVLSAADQKGVRISVTGSLQMESWVDKETNKKVYKSVIISNDIDVHAPKGDSTTSIETTTSVPASSLSDEVAALLG